MVEGWFGTGGDVLCVSPHKNISIRMCLCDRVIMGISKRANAVTLL